MPPMKPAPWAVTPGGVDPAFQGLWNGLVLAAPFWEGGAGPYDIVNGVGSSLGGGNFTWQSSEFGYVMNFPNINNRVNLLEDLPVYEIGLPASILTVVQFDAAGERPVFTNDGFGDEATNYCGYMIRKNVSERFEVHYGDNGGQSAADRRTFTGNATTLSTGKWYVLMAVIRGPTDANLYIDGVDEPFSTSGSGSPPSYTTKTPRWGRAVTTWLDGRIAATYMWNRALSGADAALLASDPFGLIRPAESGPTNPTASLYATGDATFDGVVNENDEAPA